MRSRRRRMFVSPTPPCSDGGRDEVSTWCLLLRQEKVRRRPIAIVMSMNDGAW